jgi:membrane protease YdiL (CAAX protease family)
MEPPPLVESRPSVPDNVSDAGIVPSFPVWTLGDVLRVVVVLLLSIFFTGVLSVMFVSALPAYRNATSAQIATDPRIIVPAQVVAYLVTVWFVYRMITLHYRANFWEAIHWRWPAKWLIFLVGGLCLSVLLQVVSHALPIPKKLPIDEFFKTQGGVWMMAIYGTLIAPFTEELFFRGLLYPALVRKMGMPVAIGLTSLAFALIHASQLGWSFAAVGIMIGVGLALTLVRALSGSLAASTIVHLGYNGLIFGLIFVGTHGFRKF